MRGSEQPEPNATGGMPSLLEKCAHSGAELQLQRGRDYSFHCRADPGITRYRWFPPLLRAGNVETFRRPCEAMYLLVCANSIFVRYARQTRSNYSH
eukprot:COSAG02_NODE_47251_length_342_cov_1.189300_1_plen_95_part_10